MNNKIFILYILALIVYVTVIILLSPDAVPDDVKHIIPEDVELHDIFFLIGK